jgi:hypothetical protein
MKTTTQTYMGFSNETKFWSFSPSPIRGADYVWDIANWTFEEVMHFMQLPNDDIRFAYLGDAKTVEA